jgi:hypothetical protein
MDKIREDMPVFLHDGDVAIGAVQEIRKDSLEIYFENAGDYTVPLSAVQDVHFDKLILDGRKLDKRLQARIARAHDAEDDDDHEEADD